jgi:large subunit ribosomal protein L10
LGYGDVVNPVRALSQYVKSAESTLQIKGGLLGERVLTSDEVVSLANLPPKEILVSQLITQLNTWIVGLHKVLSFPLQGLLNVLQRKTEEFSG